MKLKIELQILSNDKKVMSEVVDFTDGKLGMYLSKKSLRKILDSIEEKLFQFRERWNKSSKKEIEESNSVSSIGKTELFTFDEEILLKVAKEIISKLRPDLREKKVIHYFSVSDTQKEVIKNTSLDLIYKEEDKDDETN